MKRGITTNAFTCVRAVRNFMPRCMLREVESSAATREHFVAAYIRTFVMEIYLQRHKILLLVLILVNFYFYFCGIVLVLQLLSSTLVFHLSFANVYSCQVSNL